MDYIVSYYIKKATPAFLDISTF